jgi:hypothetical protein
MRYTYDDFAAQIARALACKYCGGHYCGRHTEMIPGNPNVYTKWCCEQAKEDVEVALDKKDISRLLGRGYRVIKLKYCQKDGRRLEQYDSGLYLYCPLCGEKTPND